MKKLLFILSCTVMTTFCAQEKTEYYPDGKVSSKGMLKDNVRTGAWIFYNKTEGSAAKYPMIKRTANPGNFSYI